MSLLLDHLGVTERDLIEAIVGALFMGDFGTVDAVSADKSHVDVVHAIKPKVADQQLDATLTKGVEVLWPGGGGALSIRGTLAKGDPVLLVGLKDYVSTVASGLPGTTDIPLHYTQETLKAIPCGAFNSGATITIEETGGILEIAGGGAKAAREGDATLVDITTDPTNFAFLTTVCAIFGMTLASLTGKVNAGSSKVEIGG